jgi:hypothetical protein
MILVTHNFSPKVLQPRKQVFDLPPPFVATQFSPVLRFDTFATGFVRRNQFDVEFLQLIIKRIRIVCFIADYSAPPIVAQNLSQTVLSTSQTLCGEAESV